MVTECTCFCTFQIKLCTMRGEDKPIEGSSTSKKENLIQQAQ